MKITMTIKLEKGDREKLSDFKKKYDSLRQHVAVLQLKGTLPRGEVKWAVERPKEPILLPPAVNEVAMWLQADPLCGNSLVPQRSCMCRHCLVDREELPTIVHRAGETLQMPISGVTAPEGLYAPL